MEPRRPYEVPRERERERDRERERERERENSRPTIPWWLRAWRRARPRRAGRRLWRRRWPADAACAGLRSAAARPTRSLGTACLPKPKPTSYSRSDTMATVFDDIGGPRDVVTGCLSPGRHRNATWDSTDDQLPSTSLAQSFHDFNASRNDFDLVFAWFSWVAIGWRRSGCAQFCQVLRGWNGF